MGSTSAAGTPAKGCGMAAWEQANRCSRLLHMRQHTTYMRSTSPPMRQGEEGDGARPVQKAKRVHSPCRRRRPISYTKSSGYYTFTNGLIVALLNALPGRDRHTKRQTLTQTNIQTHTKRHTHRQADTDIAIAIPIAIS